MVGGPFPAQRGRHKYLQLLWTGVQRRESPPWVNIFVSGVT